MHAPLGLIIAHRQLYIYIYIYVYSSGTHAQDHKLHVSKKPCAKQMYLRLGALVRGIP